MITWLRNLLDNTPRRGHRESLEAAQSAIDAIDREAKSVNEQRSFRQREDSLLELIEELRAEENACHPTTEP